MKNAMKKAHEITKNIIRKGDSYRVTFRLALSLAHSLIKKGVNKMIELVGSEKQVEWANDLRLVVLEGLERNVEWRKEQLDNKPNSKRFNRLFEESIALKNKIKNEESAKFFIDNFSYIISKKENEIKTEESLKAKDVEYSSKDAICNSVLVVLNRLA